MVTTTTVKDFNSAETPLARVIREQGRRKGWVSKQAGISIFRLSRLISGQRAMRLDEAQSLARVLGVPVETFADQGRDE